MNHTRATQATESSVKATSSPTGTRGGTVAAPVGVAATRRSLDASRLSAGDVLYLQRTVGNQAVAQLLAKQQPDRHKITVGSADDRHEQEADHIADTVRRSPRQEAESVLYRPVTGRVQRDAVMGAAGGEVDGDVERSLRHSQSSGTSMPQNVRRAIEPKLGADLSGVKVHTDSNAVQLNRQLGAKAFTHRNHIYYGAGQRPGDIGLTAHEAVHTVQQGAAPRVSRKPESHALSTPTPALRDGMVQLKRDTQADQVALDKLRKEVVYQLQQGLWPEAIRAYEDFNVTYKKSGWWGSTQLGKWSRDVSALNPDRKRAKALVTDTAKAPDKKLDDIKAVAKSIYGLSDSANVKNESNWHYMTDMVEKISYYLVAAIPPQVRDLAGQFAGVRPDLSGVLGASVSRGAPPSGVKSPRITSDERDINQALTTSAMSNRGFHGSASWLLEGLGKSGGKLLSQKAAFDAGLLKTGEGTTFSTGAEGLKRDVYIGKGETGFGTAASYAMAPATLTSYNVSLYSDAELVQTIADYRRIIHLSALLEEIDPKIAASGKSVLVGHILEQAMKAGINPVVDSNYAHMPNLQTMVQLQDMLGKLEQEVEARKSWRDDDQRRQGGLLNPDNYPILLEFDLGGLTATDDFSVKQRVQRGDYRLAGEATVRDEIDLTGGRLKVVYVPEAFIGKTQLKLAQVFGTTHPITVRALESIRGGLVSGGDTEKTINATYGQLEKLQKSLDVKIEAQKSMAKTMLDFVDKNDKNALHGSITKLMTEGVAPVPSTDTPEAVLMMGGPGSGKSSILNAILDPSELKTMVVADPDAVKAMLPSYQAGVAKGDRDIATTVHGESKQITGSVVDKAVQTRRNLLYDGTGADRQEYTKLIQSLKTAGYKVNLVMVKLDVEEGWRRVEDRRVKTGRGVPESDVRSIYTQIPDNFVALAKTVDSAFVFDNSKGKPTMVWSSAKGGDVKKEALE